MQDRYLFRGKREDNREWVYWDQFGKCTEPILTDEGMYTHISEEYVDPATVGQCTGLKDKNGELIFEGDLVTATGYSYTEPETDESGAIEIFPLGCVLWNEETLRCKNLSDLQGSYTTEYEIYGNIHDKEGEDEV